jgi:hypothetical protein
MDLKALKKCCNVVGAMALIALSACSKGNPALPGGQSGASFIAAQLMSPGSGVKVPYATQPITLTTANATATGSGPVTYTFEVASDSGFTNMVYQKSGVPQGGGGTTSLQIDRLPDSRTYYWRVRTTTGDSTGPNSPTSTFVVGPPVSLDTPQTVNPTSGATIFASVALTTNNVARSGPAGALSYRFDVSDSPAFTNLVYTGFVAEQGGVGGQTSAAVGVNLRTNATYYWRVQAIDQLNSLTTQYSSPASFLFQDFDMRQATMYSSPPGVPYWDVTAQITSVTFTGDAFLVDFDRRTGPNRWPDLQLAPGSDGTLQYTLGMCANIGGRWACSAVVQFWFDRELEASTPPFYVGKNWFYDARWGPLNGYQPENGEMVGLFVGTGNLRGTAFANQDCPQVCERSNVAFVPWHNDDYAEYTFATSSPSSVGRLLNLLKRR